MMPENKPMKMQWLNIDGRQVPSILPNHWNEQKNDWDITGTKNPLPVANYTQNASGVWLPTSKDNPVPTQLTGSIVELLGVVNNIDVPTGTTVRVLLNTDVSAFDELFIQFTTGGSENYRISYYLYNADHGTLFTSVDVFENTAGSSNRITDRFKVSSLKAEIGVTNRGSVDHTFRRLSLFGVRS